MPVFSKEMPSPYPAPESGLRLTPPESPAPLLNEPRLFGARPGSPIQFSVCASGERPMSLAAAKLPPGLKLDKETGIITGKISRPGVYSFPVQASNSHGKTQGTITIRIGQEICLTPPMGWSSWYSYSGGVSQENILKTARLLVNPGLARYGYSYVNIDDCWQGARGGKYRAIQPNKRFPDMKAMCNEIHSLGLKAGIYSSPWMGTYAGYIGGSSPIPREIIPLWLFRKTNVRNPTSCLAPARGPNNWEPPRSARMDGYPGCPAVGGMGVRLREDGLVPDRRT